MGITIISIITCITAIALQFIRHGHKIKETSEIGSLLDSIIEIVGMFSFFVTIITTSVIVINSCSEEAFMLGMHEREQLIYQKAETGICSYDKCILDEIAEYNTEILKGKSYNSNIFIGKLYHEGYNLLEPISYDIITKENHKEHKQRTTIEKS